MTRTTAFLGGLSMLAVVGCGTRDPGLPPEVNCAIADDYEFKNIGFDFTASGDGTWFQFFDNTPGGMPNADTPLMTTEIPAPGRCGDNRMLRMKVSGHNYYGAGFGSYANNMDLRSDGTGYEGISFWARSEPNTDKTFMFYVDDGRTFVSRIASPTGGGLLPVATELDQDLDGDGFVGPGDIVRHTQCRLPPIQALGEPACYRGGVQPPGSPTRVPEPGECGNQFHTYITTTTEWQLFLIPWDQLVQWPCPNRLEGGINPADIAKFEIKMLQGTVYDLWLDNVRFYRRRAGS